MIEAIGIEYTDIFPSYTAKGGVRNFLGTQHIIGYGTCVWNEDFNKIQEYYGLTIKAPNIKKALIMYGDRCETSSFSSFSPEYLAVDFADTFMKIPEYYLSFWRQRANLLLFSIPDELCNLNFPLFGTDVVAHSPKGVYCNIGNNKFIVENKGYNPNWKNLIGAGDFFSSNLLQKPINEESINQSIISTVEFLRQKNEKI